MEPGRPTKPDWNRLFELAVGQEGLFTTKQAAEAGYSPKLLSSATTERADCRGSIPSRFSHLGLHTLCLRFAMHLAMHHAKLDTVTFRCFH
jgi:hypothetical protein